MRFEQGEASNEIARHVEQIARMSETDSLASSEIAAFSDILAKLAEDMLKTALRFKV